MIISIENNLTPTRRWEAQPRYSEGMLQLDTTTSPPTLTSISVTDYIGPRINGAIVHVPVSDHGIIVSIVGRSSIILLPIGSGSKTLM